MIVAGLGRFASILKDVRSRSVARLFPGMGCTRLARSGEVWAGRQLSACTCAPATSTSDTAVFDLKTSRAVPIK